MAMTQQAALIPREGPQADPKQQAARDQPVAVAGPTSASGAANARGRWREQLDALGLKPGCAYVYRVGGRLYAWGDFTHCPAEEVAHNIHTLAEWLRKEPRRWGIGKSYDAEVHRMEKAPDWERVRREVTELYKEQWRLVGDDGSLTVVEKQEPEEHETEKQEIPERRPVMEQQTNVETRKNGHTPTPRTPATDGALSLLWDGLAPSVSEKLAQPLDPALVSSRKGRGGRSFAYVEGHAAIAQGNRIFGYGGWGYELVGDVTYREVKSVDARTGEVSVTGMYCATVRVSVPGVPPRTDVGCQALAEDTPDGHDTAFKGAVTDALKRSLRSFGDQFGNALYGDGTEACPAPGQKESLLPALKDTLLQMGKAQGLGEQQLLDAVRKKTGKALDALTGPEVAALVQAMSRKLSTAASGKPPRHCGRDCACLVDQPDHSPGIHGPGVAPSPFLRSIPFTGHPPVLPASHDPLQARPDQRPVPGPAEAWAGEVRPSDSL